MNFIFGSSCIVLLLFHYHFLLLLCYSVIFRCSVWEVTNQFFKLCEKSIYRKEVNITPLQCHFFSLEKIINWFFKFPWSFSHSNGKLMREWSQCKHSIQPKDAYLVLTNFTSIFLWIHYRSVYYNLVLRVCVCLSSPNKLKIILRSLYFCHKGIGYHACLTELDHAQGSYPRADDTRQIHNHAHVVAIIPTVFLWLSNSFHKKHNSSIPFFSPQE